MKAAAHRFLARLSLRHPRAMEALSRVLPGQVFTGGQWSEMSTQEIFSRFHDQHLWRCDESVSGVGSSVEGTRALREALPGLFERLGARSILDAPCGDLNWILHVDWDLDFYIGGDIVPQLIERLSREFADETRSFVMLDIIQDPLPQADVFFCRDCMIHLTNDQVLGVLRNMARSSCSFLMANTFPGVEFNAPSYTGAVRRLNLMRAPFYLPEPIALVEDRLDRPDFKFMGVWSREQLAHLYGAAGESDGEEPTRR